MSKNIPFYVIRKQQPSSCGEKIPERINREMLRPTTRPWEFFYKAPDPKNPEQKEVLVEAKFPDDIDSGLEISTPKYPEIKIGQIWAWKEEGRKMFFEISHFDSEGDPHGKYTDGSSDAWATNIFYEKFLLYKNIN